MITEVALSSCGGDKRCEISGGGLEYESGETASCSLAFGDNTLGGDTTCTDGEFDRSVCKVSCGVSTAVEPPACYCDLNFYVMFEGRCVDKFSAACCDCLSSSNCLTQQTDDQCKVALDSGGTIYYKVSCDDQNICHDQCTGAITGYGH